MNRSKLFYLLAVLFLVGAGLAARWFLFDRRLSARAALRVESFPKTTVFINEKEVGQTPFLDEKMIAGEYAIKLVPKTAGILPSWQTKIKLAEGTVSYVSRDIALAEDQSAGQILLLEPISSGKLGEVAVVSTPDAARVFLDSLDQGRAPLVIRNVAVGDHQLIVSADGYTDQVVRGKVVGGYRLNAIVKLGALANSQTATNSGQLRSASDLIATASGQELTKPYVVVKDTPLGFLRVRMEPSVTATEVGQVKPGEKYPLLSETDGWVKIKLPTVFGWASEQYVEKVKF